MRWSIFISVLILALCVLFGVARAAPAPAMRPATPSAIDGATAAMAHGDWIAAQVLLQAYLQKFPADAKAHYMLGVADWRMSDNVDGLAEIRAAEHFDPTLSFALPPQLDAIEGELLARQPYVVPVDAAPVSDPMVGFLLFCMSTLLLLWMLSRFWARQTLR
jgi:hypothetical protein